MTNSVFIATSLDGFIAETDGGIDWLVDFPNPDNNDYGFAEFIKKDRRPGDGTQYLRNSTHPQGMALSDACFRAQPCKPGDSRSVKRQSEHAPGGA